MRLYLVGGRLDLGRFLVQHGLKVALVLVQQALGRHVEWTVRSLQRPILTVTDRFKTPGRVLIAFDGSAITRTFSGGVVGRISLADIAMSGTGARPLAIMAFIRSASMRICSSVRCHR